MCLSQIKDFKDVPGVGMGHQLLDKEGRKPLADKDLKTLTPVEPAAKEDAKGKAEAAPAATEGGGGGGEAPAPADGGSGGGGGGDDGAPAGEEEGGDEEGAGGDGEVKAATVRPVSVANQTQCCGGLKSGVCTLI